MPGNTSPIFIKQAYANGTPVSFSDLITNVENGAGATTIVTGAENGSLVRGIQFMAPGEFDLTALLIYHKTGTTRRLVGSLLVVHDGTVPPGGVTLPWSGTWENPNPGPLKDGDSFEAGAISGDTVFHAWALGGDY